MTTDKELIRISRILDNTSTGNDSESIKNKAGKLTSVLSKLQELPSQEVPSELDQELTQRISNFSSNKAPLKREKTIFPFIIAMVVAAGILYFLLFHIWHTENPQEHYATMNNPQKINNLSQLYHKPVTQEKMNWLQEVVRTESNPNIKVLALDILIQNEMYLDPDAFASILQEKHPTVQMALLENIQKAPGQSEINILIEFQKRQNLDVLVIQKTSELLQPTNK